VVIVWNPPFFSFHMPFSFPCACSAVIALLERYCPPEMSRCSDAVLCSLGHLMRFHGFPPFFPQVPTARFLPVPVPSPFTPFPRRFCRRWTELPPASLFFTERFSRFLSLFSKAVCTHRFSLSFRQANSLCLAILYKLSEMLRSLLFRTGSVRKVYPPFPSVLFTTYVRDFHRLRLLPAKTFFHCFSVCSPGPVTLAPFFVPPQTTHPPQGCVYVSGFYFCPFSLPGQTKVPGIFFELVASLFEERSGFPTLLL